MLKGLTESEAKQKLTEFGLNEIPQSPPDPWWKLLFTQFTNFVVVILLIAGIFSLLIREFIDAAFIIFIVIINSLLGFYQEIKAQKDIRSLRSMVNPVTRVIRNGTERLIEVKLLVPDDLVIVGAGDKIPADGELTETTRMTVNEAILTGESAPVEKLTGDILYMATTVLSGHGIIKITKTGQNTDFGKVAKSLVDIKDENTPLEEKIEKFGKGLGIIIILSGLVFFLIGIVRGISVTMMFLQTVSIVVAVIPEGLPAIFTITMAVGLQRMAKRKAIIRKLSASEGLGCVNVICTDKTGTLTKNEMTVKKIWLENNSEFKVTGVGYTATGEIKTIDNNIEKTYQNDKNDFALNRLVEAGVICNNSSLAIKEGKNLEYDVLGDTTEGSLLILALKTGVSIEEIKSKHRVVDEYAFDNQRMMMSVLVESKVKSSASAKATADKQKSKEYVLFTKGAPEKVLEICNISPDEKYKALQKLEEMGKEGLRVLAFAYKELRIKNQEVRSKLDNSETPNTGEVNKELRIKNEENNLTFLGLVGIYDPPREEVKETIRIAGKAGVRTVMLTGDNPLTAAKVAQEIGLYQDGDEIITSEQMESYSSEVFEQKLDKVNVFARINPLDKLKIVAALQKKQLVVGVTGDGINDAPALKKADIGVAMGITGTDVAKESADIIITDDNYATIVKAIEEGRVIYDNILKAIKYLISSNLGESLTVAIALVLGWPIPLVPQQILWINLVSDGLPALAMAVDPKDPYVMDKMPRDRNAGLLTGKDWKYLAGIGLVEALICLVVFRTSLLYFNQPVSSMIVFSVLVFVDLIVAFIIRGRRQPLFNNKTLIAAVVSALVMQFIIVTVPGIRDLFMR